MAPGAMEAEGPVSPWCIAWRQRQRRPPARRRSAKMSRQWQGPWQGVVEWSEKIGRKKNRGDHAFELGHFIGRKLNIIPLQLRERLVELFQAVSIAAPM